MIYPASKGQSWNSNPGFSDPEDCMHVHCTASLSAMHVPLCPMPMLIPNAHHQLSFPCVCPVPSAGSGVGKLWPRATSGLLPDFVWL